MKNKIGTKQNMEQKLTHEMSMKLMIGGQCILEIEDRYMHCLSRDMQDKVREAAKLIREVADECMTDMTRERMLNWQADKYVPSFTRVKDAWEIETPEKKLYFRDLRRRKCAQGFLGDPIRRNEK